MLDQYFEHTSGGYLVGEKIRKMIVFAKHNIFRDAPFSKLDLIVCRNMFIYVKPEMQQKALAAFYQLLAEDGYVFLGSSDPWVIWTRPTICWTRNGRFIPKTRTMQRKIFPCTLR